MFGCVDENGWSAAALRLAADLRMSTARIGNARASALGGAARNQIGPTRNLMARTTDERAAFAPPSFPHAYLGGHLRDG